MRSSRSVVRRRPRRRERSRILVVAEGKVTEVQYIQGIAQHLRATGVAVRQAQVKGVGRDPSHVLAEAVRIRDEDPDGYDTTWIVVDVDDHATLETCLREAVRGEIRVIVSNPCFEVWLLWHFEDLSRSETRAWLRRKLRAHGHDGKSLPTTFPYDSVGGASARADAPGRRVSAGARGPCPSSAMPRLLEALCAND